MHATSELELDAASALLDRARAVSGAEYPTAAAMVAAVRGDRGPGLELVRTGRVGPDGAPLRLLYVLERYDDMERLFASMPDRDTRFSLGLRLGTLGAADLARGEVARAEDRLREAHGMAALLGLHRAETFAATMLAVLLGRRGQFAEARLLLDADPDPALVMGARGAVELAAGNVASAHHLLGERVLFADSQGFGDATFVPWAWDVVDAAARAGDADRVGWITRWLATSAERTGSTATAALAAAANGHAAAVLDDGPFREALELDALDPRPFNAARFRLAWGARLHRANRRADARRQLRAARDGFEALGDRAWMVITEAELVASGEARVRRRPDELTPQELAVARRAATGATVRQIAADVFLSAKTVESHLSSVYRKLGISGRVALAEVMRTRAS